MNPLRVIFAGTPEFACPSLAALNEADCQVILVITQPDRPAGRGRRLSPPAVKSLANRLGLPLMQPDRIDTPELRRRLEALGPDVVVVVAFGHKIPPWLLTLPPWGCLNAHASLLPRYRGAAPIQRALMNGDEETGVTIMRLDEGWDTGTILRQRSIRVAPEEDAGALHDRLAAIGAELLAETLAGLAAGTVVPVAQDDSLATKAPKLRPEETRLDWREPALKLHNLVRALAPAPLAETFHGAGRLQVARTQVVPSNGQEAPGTILEIKAEGALVRTGNGGLRLIQVKPANGRLMSAADYARGYHLHPRDVLG